jgi:hypothetical protein
MFKKIVFTLILFNLALVAYFYTRPYSFYKVIAIRSVKDFNSLIESDSINLDDFIIKTISSLPEKSGTVYTHNEEKRKKKFLEGYGNCSNQAVALGTILNDQNKRFQVIHLMPIHEFLEGGGHTVLQTSFKDTLMIFDLSGRSILKKEDKVINYRDLDSLANLTSGKDISLQILNPYRSKTEIYYTPDSTKNIIIGMVPDKEYEKFYSFTKHLYTPEKESRITQAFFYSLTAMINKLPHIYVQESDFDKFNENKKFKIDRFLSFGLVVNTWAIFLFAIIFFLNKLYIRTKTMI